MRDKDTGRLLRLRLKYLIDHLRLLWATAQMTIEREGKLWLEAMLLGLFILLHVLVSDPWCSDIGMSHGYFILGVKLSI